MTWMNVLQTSIQILSYATVSWIWYKFGLQRGQYKNDERLMNLCAEQNELISKQLDTINDLKWKNVSLKMELGRNNSMESIYENRVLAAEYGSDWSKE